MIGTLGNFEIMSQIGKGGMGVVYRAKDQKLDRDVAIKILPEEFAKDADRVARFQREAKLLASLNHPNIAAIYGLEESDGTHFLVLELVEGDTLADRIKEGPIPVEESLKLALQIAEALEAAHEKGIIHRDLKPANIKVTPEGTVKVLDFGLAKVFAGDQVEVNLSHSSTLSEAATMQGVILGTAAYMSPEQARGKPVDKRTDIWAFGCVLYEMLMGKAAFQGEDVTEILAAVVKSEVKLDLLPANIHPRVREVLTRCLQKEQKKRYGSIGEAQYEIEQVLADPSGVFVQPITTVKPRKKLRVGIPWVAVALIVASFIVGVAVWNLKPTESRQVMRFEYELPEGQQFTSTNNIVSSLAMSPDGRQLVYATPKGLYLRSLDQLTAKLIVGTESDTVQPFFSPDGKSVGYFSPVDQQLKKIAISGGSPITLCSITGEYMLGASWNRDDTIIYGQAHGDIMRVSANGGTPESIIKPKSPSGIFPHMLPDGKSVLYTDITDLNQGSVMVQSLNSDKPKELYAGFAVGYLPTGHIIYGLPNDDNLYAIPFDLDTMEVRGGSVPIVEGVMGNGIQSAISDSGTLVYVPGGTGDGGSMPVWIDTAGNVEEIDVPMGDYLHPRISRDGRWLAVERAGGDGADIYIYEISGKTELRRLTEGGNNRYPTWSRNGEYIAFQSERDGDGGIFRRRADGTGGVDRLTTPESGSRHIPESWSPTRDVLAFSVVRDNAVELWMLNVEDGSTERFGEVDSNMPFDAVFSPDGEWIAYTQRGRGVSTWVHSVANPQTRYQIRQDQESIHHPLWSRDGTQLVYFPGSEPAQAVDIRTEPSFGIGRPVQVPGIGLPNTSANTLLNHDVAPDGRFVVSRSGFAADGVEASESVIVVTNWFEELKQRVPVK